MNRFFQTLILLFIFGIAKSIAQPVITAAGFNPQIGDQFKIQETKIIHTIPVLSGSNSVWDFSNLKDSGAPKITKFISPANLLGKDSFPGANLATRDSSAYPYNGNTWFFQNSFFTTSQQSWNFNGVHESKNITKDNNTAIWTPAQPFMVYPMYYGKSFTDSIQASYSSSDGYWSSHPQFDTLIGVGYGTLKLPTATYSNVLCVYESNNQVINASYAERITSYWFITNGIHYPLLKLEYNTSNDTWWVSYYSGIPLPLQIVAFTASWQNKMPSLTWKATNQENTKFFNIQRSTDGFNFVSVGQVAATNFATAYHFLDTFKTINTLYYRLQQIDKDGKSYYSKISTLHPLGIDFKSTISPNPAKNIALLNFSHQIEKATIEVINSNGTIAISQELHKATDAYQLNTQNLPNGMYLIKLITNQGSIGEKLLINK